METKEKVTREEAKEIVDMVGKLHEDDVKIAKGYLSAFVDMQELKNQKEAG